MDYLQYAYSEREVIEVSKEVLNLIINGLPSIHKEKGILAKALRIVLNLIINGLPSILKESDINGNVL